MCVQREHVGNQEKQFCWWPKDKVPRFYLNSEYSNGCMSIGDTLVFPVSHAHTQGYDNLTHSLQSHSTVRCCLANQTIFLVIVLID